MKKMLLSLALALPILLYCQSRHELKVDLHGPLFFDDFHLAYEYMPAPKWGLEFGLRYDWHDIKIDTLRPDPSVPYGMHRVALDRDFLDVLVSGKHYLSPKHGSDRFFLGVYWWNQWEAYRDPAYDDYREKVYPNSTVKDRKWLRSALGLKGGYKWAIRDRFIVEPVFGIDFNFVTALEKDPHFDYDAIAFIKAGYRFGKTPTE